MSSGLQVFDAAGRIALDVTDRVCKVLGTVLISPGSSGSVGLPDLQGNQPFVLFVPNVTGSYGFGGFGGFLHPVFEVMGTSIGWHYEGSAWANKVGGTFVYGIF